MDYASFKGLKRVFGFKGTRRWF